MSEMQTVPSAEGVLRELQLKELDILKNVIEIMERMGIKYYLSAGTLLGAVRHGGFIPWDDDIDIMLTRTDFEKFLREASDYLPDYYRLVHYSRTYDDETDVEMRRRIASHVIAIQIQDTRYSVRRTSWSQVHTQNIWIDIAALDEMPDNKMIERWYHSRLSFLHLLLKVHRLEYKADGHRSHAKIADVALAVNRRLHFARLIHPLKVIADIDSTLRHYDGKGFHRYINFMGEYKFREVVPVTFLGRETFLSFEGIPMRVPEHYDVYLRAIYGDYMKFPPVEERVSKHKLSVIENA